MTIFSGNGYTIEYGFHELADGERALIALYALIYYARSADITLCIDHPTHFIALPTIQPWLKLLDDFCNGGELQALLISHHPLLIDYLAFPTGYWFDRDYDDMPVRARRFTDDETAGMPISQYVARNWISG